MPYVIYNVRVITRVMSWHASSRVNYRSTSRVNLFTKEILAFYMRKIVGNHACRNEVIIERYCICMFLLEGSSLFFKLCPNL